MELGSLRPCILALTVGCGLPEGDYFGRVPDPDPDHLFLCNSGEPEYLDPALATATTDIKPIYAMFDGLTEYDLEGLPEPSLATSWEIAPDQRRFTFHLRRDARWSDGTPLLARDFAYSLARVLHPLTASKNAETLWKLKNGELYTANRVRRLLRDAAGLRAGDIVEVVGLDGDVAANLAELDLPDSNLRASSRRLALRDLGASPDQAYATAAPGRPVTLVELDRGWAYVFLDEEDGVYGWVPLADLDRQPHAATRYTVRRIRSEHVPDRTLPPDPDDTPRVTAIVRGADLLMTPDVLGVRAPDDHTLVLETWGPLPYMIDLTPHRAFRAAPRRAISRWPKRWTMPEHIITSGAYHMADWRIRDRIELVRSPTFWDRAGVRVERLTLFSLADQTASTHLYMQGTCDAMVENNIPPAYLPYLIGSPSAPARYRDFVLAPYLGVYYYNINTTRLDNVHFRRALNLAVDRSQLASITRGGELGSAQFMPGAPIRDLSPDDLALCGVTRDTPGVAVIVEEGKLCYVPPPGLEFDPARAREEMATARRELGARFPPRISIKFNSGFESHKLVAEWLQSEWQRHLGIEVVTEVQEWKTFLKDTRGGEYDLARTGWQGNFPDPEAEFLPLFKCASPNNHSKFCSREFDSLMARAEATLDRKQRLALAREAERLMIEQAPIIPLYVYTQKHLRKPYVRDLAINIVSQMPLRRVWIDTDWQRPRPSP